MSHPSSLDLEAFAVGEPLPEVFAGHVDGCANCAAFVGQLRTLVATGPSATEADDAVSRVVARTAIGASIAPDVANDVSTASSPPEPKRTMWLLVTSVVAPLAAAAAIMLLARPEPLTPSPAPQVTVSRIQMAPFPSTRQAESVATEPDTQFKGGLQVAVVRERAGEQARFSRAVQVRPGDRIRVEVALDREQAILAAVLGDDGSYLELMPEAVRGPGTHFSEKSAKFDAAPTRGTILIGTREAIARAKGTHQFDGVTTVRVEWEAP